MGEILDGSLNTEQILSGGHVKLSIQQSWDGALALSAHGPKSLPVAGPEIKLHGPTILFLVPKAKKLVEK